MRSAAEVWPETGVVSVFDGAGGADVGCDAELSLVGTETGPVTVSVVFGPVNDVEKPEDVVELLVLSLVVVIVLVVEVALEGVLEADDVVELELVIELVGELVVEDAEPEVDEDDVVEAALPDEVVEDEVALPDEGVNVVEKETESEGGTGMTEVSLASGVLREPCIALSVNMGEYSE